ncbi:MAG: dipeptide ABC transporter ATP-binding protein [Gemmobacter sp.]
MPPAPPLLSVEHLTVGFGPGVPPVVDDLSFALARGETLAIVGESGSGKTLSGRALMGLLPRGAAVTRGAAWFRPDDAPAVDLLALPRPALRRLCGARIAMIFQEPMSALSPLHTIGAQVAEALTLHAAMTPEAARARCLETFAEVGFPDPERAWAAYPFELSGGLRQRGGGGGGRGAPPPRPPPPRPDLVIADEPTTALDVTTQAQVLDLMKGLQARRGMALILITHDLGVVCAMADRVAVLRRGRLMEAGTVAAVIGAPGHGYTRALVAAAPMVPADATGKAASGDPILSVSGLNKTFAPRRRGLFDRSRGAPVAAVRDVSFTLGRGQTLAIVGESGSGKSTVARLVLRAETADPGATVTFRGRDGQTEDVLALRGPALKAFRARVQIVFQDPYAALSPRMPVADILTEPLLIHGRLTPRERRERAADLMRQVGLSPDHLGRYPHAFSGGQRQRISIARALALEPELLICDEPTSALDVSVQAQVLALFKALRDALELSYLFISHNLAVVADLADHVAVMRAGRIVEQGPVAALFGNPVHPYTRALIAASPEPILSQRLDLAAVAQGAGAPQDWPSPFGYRGDAAPPLTEVAPAHFVRIAA